MREVHANEERGAGKTGWGTVLKGRCRCGSDIFLRTVQHTSERIVQLDAGPVELTMADLKTDEPARLAKRGVFALRGSSQALNLGAQGVRVCVRNGEAVFTEHRCA